nr:ATP-binding cassette domain-containing protein [Williamsia sp. CHRR-6]
MLTKRYGDFTAVDGVDLDVSAGTVFAVLGPNGAGKTTTVRMLATLVAPTSGHASVFGFDVVADAVAVRSLIGLTGQYASVDEDMTAAENLMLFSRLIGLSRRQSRARADDLLESFALADVADRQIKTFSGGMRRRLDLAASMIAAPPLLFLDEPTTGLDPRTRQQMWSTVRTLVAEGTTVLLTTQYLEEADQLADRIAVIDHGRLVAEGTADSLKDAVGTSTLEVTVGVADAVMAGRILGHLSPGTVTVGVDGIVNVALTDTAAVGPMLVALADHGIVTTSVAVAKPTLDDVFFAITDQTGRTSMAAGAIRQEHAA